MSWWQIFLALWMLLYGLFGLTSITVAFGGYVLAALAVLCAICLFLGK